MKFILNFIYFFGTRQPNTYFYSLFGADERKAFNSHNMNGRNFNVFFLAVLTLLALTLQSHAVFAQQVKRVSTSKQIPTVRREIQRSEVTQKESYPQTISVQQGNPQVVHDAAFYQSEISRMEDQIKAIDQKVILVQSDPDADAEAKKNGWYDQMNLTKDQLSNQCETYKALLK